LLRYFMKEIKYVLDGPLLIGGAVRHAHDLLREALGLGRALQAVGAERLAGEGTEEGFEARWFAYVHWLWLGLFFLHGFFLEPSNHRLCGAQLPPELGAIGHARFQLALEHLHLVSKGGGLFREG
jgi:hypothetical protein